MPQTTNHDNPSELVSAIAEGWQRWNSRYGRPGESLIGNFMAAAEFALDSIPDAWIKPDGKWSHIGDDLVDPRALIAQWEEEHDRPDPPRP